MRLMSLLLGVAILAIFVTWNLRLFETSLEQSTTVLNPPTTREESVPEGSNRSSSPATPTILVPGMEARNTERRADVTALLDALFQYSVENGMEPDGIGGSPTEICKQDAASCSGLLDLSTDLVDQYLAEIPVDPKADTEGNGTRYAVALEGGRITVNALNAEGGDVISATR